MVKVIISKVANVFRLRCNQGRFYLSLLGYRILEWGSEGAT